MVEHSLKALQTEYIDLLLVHYPKDWGASDGDSKNPDQRVRFYRILEQYKDAGKIRSIGVSNFEPRHIDELLKIAKHKPVANQCEYHPHLTRPELVEYCKSKGIFFQAHTSLAKDSRSLYSEPSVREIAAKHKCTIQQLLLAFAYSQQIGIIPKSGNPDRIKGNMQCVDVNLSTEDVDELAKLNKGENRGQYSDCDGWNVK